MIKPLKVLVVEDEPNTREITEILLQELGHQVTSCGNGLEAVRLCADDGAGFDVVLMDVQMPVMDGFEAIRQLRARDATRDLPIVCVSARSSHATREEGMRAGCDLYLTKPLPQEQVFGAVTEALRARGRLDGDETFA